MLNILLHEQKIHFVNYQLCYYRKDWNPLNSISKVIVTKHSIDVLYG